MADRIVIEGVRRYEGEYEIDLVGEPLTILEQRWIKKISGYLPVEYEVGWRGQDPDLFLALGVIAMRRDGKIEKDDALNVSRALEDGATIRLVFDEQEAEPNPPVAAPEPQTSNGDSGGRSSLTSDRPGPNHTDTGNPGSERSADSVPATLVI